MFEHLDPGWWHCQGTCVFFRGGTPLEEVGHGEGALLQCCFLTVGKVWPAGFHSCWGEMFLLEL